MVQRLVERFDPDEIILFGSHARGTAQPGSDIDLLVILPYTGSKRAKQVEMRMALHDIPAPTDIIVATPVQVAQQREVVGTLIRPALQEGKTLYARTRSRPSGGAAVGAKSREGSQIARRVRRQVRTRLPRATLKSL
jgi:predicted nucleotidyltransferase